MKFVRSYAVVFAAIVLGFVLRGVLNLTLLRIPPYHCYPYDETTAICVLIGSLLLPLVAARTRQQAVSLLALSVFGIAGGASLATWNPALLVPCSPL
jgi:hypothetical protein